MQGQLFSQDFLIRGISETPPHQDLTDAAFAAFREGLAGIFQGFSVDSSNNEAQTEQLVIHKVLAALGWADDFLPQVNADPKGREAVPDCLLFASSDKKAAALRESKDDRRYRHGLAILEAKRWLRPLDRGDGKDVFDPDAPSSQMLRYLSRVDVASDRAIKWGMLTNGAVWRLYWQDARSRAEEFFEVDVAAALGLPGVQHELEEIEPGRALRLFYLFFQRQAFLPQAWDNSGRTFHAFALNEARLYEEKVSQDLGSRVFGEVFPQLADALARGDLHAVTQEVGYGQFKRPQFTREYLDEVREAALVLLYRLLFLFYAEDRNLLPVSDANYFYYSFQRIRRNVRQRRSNGIPFASSIGPIWQITQSLCATLHCGDDSIGITAYTGALFHPLRSPLLARVHVSDSVFAPVVDAFTSQADAISSFSGSRSTLTFVALGCICERLLSVSLVTEEPFSRNFIAIVDRPLQSFGCGQATRHYTGYNHRCIKSNDDPTNS